MRKPTTYIELVCEAHQSVLPLNSEKKAMAERKTLFQNTSRFIGHKETFHIGRHCPRFAPDAR